MLFCKHIVLKVEIAHIDLELFCNPVERGS